MQPNLNIISKIEAEKTAAYLSKRDGEHFEFFRFLNLSRFSLVFKNDTGRQIVLAGDSIKRILKEEAL